MGEAARATLSRRTASDRPALGGKSPEVDPIPPGTVELLGGRRIKVASGASTEERIQAIAERQRARFTRKQLLALGVNPRAITRRLRSGRLESGYCGVYALPNTVDLPLAPESAALLACGEGAVLSLHSAATLWKLRPGIARPVHVTIPGERGCPALSGVQVHRSTTITSMDVRIRDGLPLTSPARTLLDDAPNLTDRDVERLLDEGLFALRIVTPTQIDDVLARAGGHPGRARLERVSRDHLRSTETDSPPEERLLALIRAAGMPEPDLRVNVLGYRLDFFWPELKLAVEVDAYGTHGSPARFEADRRRDAKLLTEAGIVVLRFTKAAIEQRPFEVIGVLAWAIGQREPALRPV